MRISDWSSDVCSSDLVRIEDLQVVSFRRELRGDGRPSRVAQFRDLLGGAGGIGVNHRLQALAPRVEAALRERLHVTVHRLDLVAPRSLGRQELVLHLLEMRSEEHTSELQSLMRNSYAALCLKKKITSTETIMPSYF